MAYLTTYLLRVAVDLNQLLNVEHNSSKDSFLLLNIETIFLHTNTESSVRDLAFIFHSNNWISW